MHKLAKILLAVFLLIASLAASALAYPSYGRSYYYPPHASISFYHSAPSYYYFPYYPRYYVHSYPYFGRYDNYYDNYYGSFYGGNYGSYWGNYGYSYYRPHTYWW